MKNIKSLLLPYKYLLIISVVLGLISPAIYTFYLIIGFPDPLFVTHGPLAFTPAENIITLTIYLLIVIFIVTIIYILFIIFSKKKIMFLLSGVVILSIQVIFIVVAFVIAIATTR